MSFTDLITAHRRLTAGLRHDGSRRAWDLACPGDEPWHGAVQDADEAIAEGAEGCVVGVAGGSAVVVEGPGSW